MAFDLHESGVAMKRAQLRRAFPAMAEFEIDRTVADWLRRRSGADFGDVSIDAPAEEAVRR